MSDHPENYKRINIMIRQDQYQRVAQTQLNMSGLVRGLLDDHFSDDKIVFSVSEPIKSVYQNVISNLGADDKDLEPYFLEALDQYLASKSKQIEELRRTLPDAQQTLKVSKSG